MIAYALTQDTCEVCGANLRTCSGGELDEQVFFCPECEGPWERNGKPSGGPVVLAPGLTDYDPFLSDSP